jgi:hypothetical protein
VVISPTAVAEMNIITESAEGFSVGAAVTITSLCDRPVIHFRHSLGDVITCCDVVAWPSPTAVQTAPCAPCGLHHDVIAY